MNYLYKILIISLMIPGGISCEKVIDFKGAETKPKIVFYANLQSDSLISCQIALSYAVFETNYSPSQIKNADVKLFKDDEFLENLSYTDPPEADIINGDYEINYFSNYSSSGLIPDPQSEYRFEVSVPGYNSVQSTTRLPETMNILSFDTTVIEKEYTVMEYYPDSKTVYSFKEIHVKIKFSDPPNEDNFYRLAVNQFVGRYAGDKFQPFDNSVPIIISNYGGWITTTDPLLNPSEEEDIFGSYEGNEFNLFSDEKIAGKSYELNFQFVIDNNSIDTSFYEFLHYHINLQSISKDFYYYLSSFSKHNMAEGGFLVEPVLVYSNIENGLGVFGATSNTLKSIKYGQFPVEGVDYISEKEYWSEFY
ncbi:MAG: DUF4249 domain-containing protein [Bacteroidales bacterium]|nr:DUF4249 domain-containing protein [Bacteroidales bacterium]MCF8406066.1 DUF4249 domain-containing protein [Bacteroidales bacterium]